jgi:hypothetical protein
MNKNPESYQWLVLFFLQALALVLLSQLNQSLSTFSLFLFINGLFIAFPALFLPLGQGVASIILLTIFYDSGESWKLGTSLIPYLTIFTLIYHIRGRIRFEKKRGYKSVILLTNLTLYTYYTVLAGIQYGVTSSFVFLNLVHLMVSQLVLLTLAGWLIKFQKDVFLMFKIDIDASLLSAK